MTFHDGLGIAKTGEQLRIHVTEDWEGSIAKRRQHEPITSLKLLLELTRPSLIYTFVSGYIDTESVLGTEMLILTSTFWNLLHGLHVQVGRIWELQHCPQFKCSIGMLKAEGP